MILTLLSLAYAYPIDAYTHYDVKVELNGYLPVLSGREGVAKLDFAMKVQGKRATASDQQVLSHELTSFRVTLNDSVLPFNVDNVRAFFPLTTIELAPSGKVTKTDAPKKTLPAAIPGLDVQRLPELTYLPIEFPQHDLQIGSKWDFSRLINGAPFNYHCELSEVSEKTLKVWVSFDQTAKNFEDDELQRVPSREGAAFEVTTGLSGTGTLVFYRQPMTLKSSEVEVNSRSEVVGITSDFRGERKLKTTLRVSHRAQF